MNPLIPINAIQIRYVSPIFEPVYDDEDNQMGEDCVHDGTDVNNSYFIGTDNSSQKQFMGLIDNVLIYENKSLTSDEVTRNYNATKASHKN